MDYSVDQNRCLDWVIAPASNVHVAKDRSWFYLYKLFNTHFHEGLSRLDDREGRQPVIGIGSVKIAVKTTLSGQQSQMLTLHNVLHAPWAVCNIVCPWILSASGDFVWDVDLHAPDPLQDGMLRDREGSAVALINTDFIPRLRLLDGECSGRSIFQTKVKRREDYIIQAHWLDPERNLVERITTVDRSAPPYTDEEYSWLIQFCNSEVDFLGQMGLDFKNPSHREEGRRIARTMMESSKHDGGLVYPTSPRF